MQEDFLVNKPELTQLSDTKRLIGDMSLKMPVNELRMRTKSSKEFTGISEN